MRGTTLPGALDEAAATGPDIAVSFPSSAERLTLTALAARTTALARALVAEGVAPGERIGVFSRNNADFMTAVIAVGRAGAAACPLPLPTSAGDLAGYAARIAAVTSAAGVGRVLVGAGADGLTRRLAPVLPALRFDGIAGLVRSARDGVALPDVSPSDLAIVQFTSGSTAVPKGVVLTHRNVVHGTAAIADGIGLGVGDHGATWLPLYHDMGLFGALSAILTAVPMTIWSPSTFIKDPASWLRSFAEIGATVAPSPNFGYDALLAAVDPAEVAGLDLRRWRVALNGAEPVSPVTVQRFGAHFAPAGFAPEAMFPVYGMAEATLAVTFPPLGRPPVTTWVDRDRLARDGVAVPAPAGDAGARGLVGVGRPVRGMRLRIVDGRRRAVPDGTVGEIEIAGDAVTAGYLTAGGPPTALEADPAGERWLPTGDLGFLAAGELHVSGRRKEMIIVRGVNYYPEDAEALVRDAPGVYRRRCVAVADTDDSGAGAESLTVIAETTLDDAADRIRLAADLRVAVGSALGLAEVSVRLVAPDALPRTSSGKFRRAEARDLARQ
ncbi:acyl-CoA synthetase (AMP-forming)/AMP-acid ligase II [Frankia torreyi]|uniref:Acyl-CoA synthetase (AMP-forming)/AMP-acid ligase II n=1 Tax=Frankia torreyi TaxID=1856 RepID=A0A0D8B7P9_9ACTN|nr:MULTISPECIES: AMP-binding protein [Frankia]KJE20293.1 acyl-CoA synthetase (AMP-forming)/AMP-acid ligase II [Frankia torreyi]KQC35169.1 AMP-dependent synthetase [Frankia sp. ACN1ag]KQM05313.1 acyl-CoA synthetase (AMP-forming)/AMP-acid ligase II [Frankia sp. CpI1-P]